MIGGGVPKNFIQDTVICAELLGKNVDMHKYAIQITVADSRDGACSSSTLKEASSWGKVDSAKEQMVFAEATSVLPLIVSDAYHTGAWKNRDRKKFSKIFRLMVKKVKNGIIQSKISDNIKSNIISAIKSIKKAASKKARIICLPELFLSTYFCQTENHSNFKLAEKIPGKITDIFSNLANELGVILILSLFEKRTSGFYHNTTIIINERGKILAKYRKMHIPDDPGYYEKFYFTPGDLGFKSVKTKFGKIGPLICWDQWFPEAARLTALKGAQIIIYPTAIGWHPKEKKKFGKSQLDSWITMQKSHAIANGTFVVAINRVGTESKGRKKIEFWGNSMVINPSGQIIGKLSNNKQQILIREIDYKKIDNAREHWPFLRDRRIDFYKGILKNPEDE